jgi:hypothetical protein
MKGHVFGGLPTGHSLQRFACEQQLFNVIDRQLNNAYASKWRTFDKSASFQRPNCLAQRTAAHAEARRERLFGEFFSRLEPPCKDGLFQPRNSLINKRPGHFSQDHSQYPKLKSRHIKLVFKNQYLTTNTYIVDNPTYCRHEKRRRKCVCTERLVSVRSETVEAVLMRQAGTVGSEHDAAAITARIDRLPESRRIWWLVVLLALAGLFEVYDLYQTAYVPTGLVRAGIFSQGAKGLFGLPDQATLAASTFLGLFLGSIAFAPVADKFGRRPIIVWALVVYSLATLAMALQSTAYGVFICRLLAGNRAWC